MQPNFLRVAIFNTDIPVDQVFAARGLYGNLFQERLDAAVRRSGRSTRLKYWNFNTQLEQYPPSLTEFDAIIVSGSAASAYDDRPWIKALDTYLQDVYARHPRIKIFGSCFGHQIIAQCLLRPYGAVVEPGRWENGVQEITFSNSFSKHLAVANLAQHANLPTPPTTPTGIPSKASGFRMQFVHHDHVRLSSTQALPPNWMNIGSSKLCDVQGLFEPARILTFQGHFEFDRFVNYETIKAFAPHTTWTAQDTNEALNATQAEDDAETAADFVLQFFLGQDKLPVTPLSRPGRLLTPPERNGSKYV